MGRHMLVSSQSIISMDEGLALTFILDLKLLHTHPDHQKRGAGSSLIKWGTEEADRLGIPAFLESSPQGLSLYKKCGFEVLDTVTVDLSPWEGPSKVDIPLMQRDVKKV